MQDGLPASVPIAGLIPPVFGPFAAPVESALRRWILPVELQRILDRARSHATGPAFARSVLDSLDIRFTVDDRDLQRIPRQGSTVLVANHPFGIAEGLILMVLLDSVRWDFKIVANSLLSSVDAIRDRTVLVNPFEGPSAAIENCRPVRDCWHWLMRGGLLALFPAGEVAHLCWDGHTVTDPPWKTAAARLALRTESTVVPVFFEGGNGLMFHLAGTLHPGFRTLSLPREFGKMRRRTVHLRIGSAIPYSVLHTCGDAVRATEYLRSRTFFLANRPWPAAHHARPDPAFTRTGSTAAPADERSLAEEVAALPASCELARGDEFAVFCATSTQIPRLLSAIGERREEAFQRVGEGTGKGSDLDRFDRHYHHLFLWHKSDRRLAGAYRLAITTDVIREFGVRGLYTSTLFRFGRGFMERLGPAVELGRSFICPEYQRSYAGLLLLWKGITRFVLRRPEAAVLFGAVSISREYQEASRGLIATYLTDRASHELARMVRPRIQYRDSVAGKRDLKKLAAMAASIEDLSLSIADIEEDGKGVPVLIRQYLKAGGKLIAFNVDASFSHSVDALILTDLRTAPVSMLERCMGRAAASAFLETHAAGPSEGVRAAG